MLKDKKEAEIKKKEDEKRQKEEAIKKQEEDKKRKQAEELKKKEEELRKKEQPKAQVEKKELPKEDGPTMTSIVVNHILNEEDKDDDADIQKVVHRVNTDEERLEKAMKNKQ